MKWLQALRGHLPAHKYAINAKLLGDDAELAWSNLGYWQADALPYPAACRALADHLAQAVGLNSNDRLLDLGCGQGASLLHWQAQYQVRQLSAVELQPACVAKIQRCAALQADVRCGSFLDLKRIFPQPAFDAALCIDAAYHCSLNAFLPSVYPVLAANGRLGFHYLMLSEKYLHLNALQKLRYQALLKAADVSLQDLLLPSALHQCLEKFKFTDIQIQDISAQVFAGFSAYEAGHLQSNAAGVDRFKIQATAKLCRILYEEGIVRYVQIAARKAG